MKPSAPSSADRAAPPQTELPKTRVPRRVAAGVILLGIVGGSAALYLGTPGDDSDTTQTFTAKQASIRSESTRQLTVVRPVAGGIDRRIVQTGSVEAIESADVYAKVSGYLRAVHVNIGGEVKRGDLLAELDVPEIHQELQRRKGLLEQARGEARKFDARLNVMQAEQETAAATVREAESRIQSHVLERQLHERESERFEQLVRQGAIEETLLEEKRHRTEIARAAEGQAREAVRVANAKWAELGPRIELAEAEAATAHAAVEVAAADVEQAEIMVRYCRITAPFDGVVTQRHVDPGSFVRSAADGGSQPMFRLSRADQMKVVVSVPDRFVPFVNPGDDAEVRIDALRGEVFRGSVSRVARFQDRKTRTMRVEIDLPNPVGRLVDGMYGAVAIESPPPVESVTVPAASLPPGTENGWGDVFVVRDGWLKRARVWVGKNDGRRAEVYSGVKPDSLIACEFTEAKVLGEGQLAEVEFRPLDQEEFLAGSGTQVGASAPAQP